MVYKMLQPYTRSVSSLAQVDLRPGDLVKHMSVADVSSTSSWEEQLQVGSIAIAADAIICTGISVGSTTSGNMATIAMDGVYLTMAGGNIVPGNKVAVSLDPQCIIAAGATSEIGTALSVAASGEQVVFALEIA